MRYRDLQLTFHTVNKIWFIYGLFKDAVSSSDYIASNHKVIRKQKVVVARFVVFN
jgi:hypothetical protein